MPLLFILGIHDALAEVQQHSVRCTTCWKQHCVFRVSSSCTQERHARGMLQGSALRTERIWVPTCGTHGGSRFSDHLLGEEFVSSFIERRLADEQKLWDAQCARLAMCVASPASVRWTPLPPFVAHSSTVNV